MVSANPNRLKPGLQSACDYMIALICRDGFVQAEAWLREGPTPPPDVANRVLADTPADLQPWTNQRRDEAVIACLRAWAAYCHSNAQWRQARVLDYLRSLRGRVVTAD